MHLPLYVPPPQQPLHHEAPTTTDEAMDVAPTAEAPKAKPQLKFMLGKRPREDKTAQEGGEEETGDLHPSKAARLEGNNEFSS